MTDHTLRERVRKRLIDLVEEAMMIAANPPETQLSSPSHDAVDAILREFRLQPVAVGKVDAETGEVGT